MTEVIASVLFIVGSVFTLISAIGVLRLPDLYTRMHAASKTATFGVGLIVLGGAFAMPTTAVFVKALIVIVFLFITVPTSSHLLARAAWRLETRNHK